MIVATSSLSAAGRAFAQTGDAEATIRRGLELRRQGNDALAVPYLEKAYQLSRTPRTAAQLGLVYMALGYWVDAQRYLDEALADRDNPWVGKNRQTLEAARERVRGFVGKVTITGEPVGAEVLVNGRSIGRLPLASPARVNKGDVEIQVRAPGFTPVTRSLTVSGGGSESVAVVLQRDASTAPAATGAGDAAPNPRVSGAERPQGQSSTPAPRHDGEVSPVTTVPPPDPGAAATDATPRQRSAALRPFAWGTAAAAAAGLTFGIVETFSARSKLDAFNGHTSPSPTDPSMRVPDCTTIQLSTDCKSIRDSYNSAKTLAIVGYVAGGALAATSAVLFVLSSSANDRPPDQGAPRAITCAPTLAVAGMTCAATF